MGHTQTAPALSEAWLAVVVGPELGLELAERTSRQLSVVEGDCFVPLLLAGLGVRRAVELVARHTFLADFGLVLKMEAEVCSSKLSPWAHHMRLLVRGRCHELAGLADIMASSLKGQRLSLLGSWLAQSLEHLKADQLFWR